MALADILDKPNVSRVFLLEVQARYHLPYWEEESDGDWTTTVPYTVVDFLQNGVSIGDANWAQDSDGILRRDSGAGVDPRNIYTQAVVEFYWSNKPGKFFNDRSYENRILSAPKVNLRVSRHFLGASQVGGGSVSLANGDGLFDTISALDWDGGQAKILLGADYWDGTQEVEMDYADYESQGVWKIRSWDVNRSNARIEMKDIREKVKIDIPLRRYTRDDFPEIGEGGDGYWIPIAYGRIQNAEPVLVNAANGTFKVADHAIKAVDRVTVGGNDVAWTADLAEAEVTIPSWAPEESGDEENSDVGTVRITFDGSKDGSGDLIINPADVVEDILDTWAGEGSSLDTSAFADAVTDWTLGTDSVTGRDVPIHEISAYIEEKIDALKFVSDLAGFCSGAFYMNLDGEFTVRAWCPVPGESVDLTLTEDDILGVPAEEVDTQDIITRVQIGYQRDVESDAYRIYTEEDNTGKYRSGQGTHKTLSEDGPFRRVFGAQVFGSREITMRKVPTRVWSVQCSPRAFSLLPMDSVSIEISRTSVTRIVPPEGVYEVLEVDRNLATGLVTLLLSSWRGFGDSVGFWVEDSSDFPSWFDVTTSSGTEFWDAGWSDAEKTWVKQNTGRWTDDNGFADSDDEDSYNTSVWV